MRFNHLQQHGRAWTYREGSLQPSRDGAERVEDKILAHAVDPLASRRKRTADEISPTPHAGTETPQHLTGKWMWRGRGGGGRPKGRSRERSTYLSLDVHDDHRASPVTHHKVLGVFGNQNYVVHGDIGSFGDIWGFDGDGAFGRLHVPDLVGWGAGVLHTITQKNANKF